MREPPVPNRGGYRQDWLLEVARARSNIREGRRWKIRIRKPVGDPRKAEPPQVMKYVELAEADGFRPTSVDQGRQVLLRYDCFLSERGASDLERMGAGPRTNKVRNLERNPEVAFEADEEEYVGSGEQRFLDWQATLQG